MNNTTKKEQERALWNWKCRVEKKTEKKKKQE
jgi:hypothetical protein